MGSNTGYLLKSFLLYGRLPIGNQMDTTLVTVVTVVDQLRRAVVMQAEVVSY